MPVGRKESGSWVQYGENNPSSYPGSVITEIPNGLKKTLTAGTNLNVDLPGSDLLTKYDAFVFTVGESATKVDGSFQLKRADLPVGASTTSGLWLIGGEPSGTSFRVRAYSVDLTAGTLTPGNNQVVNHGIGTIESVSATWVGTTMYLLFGGTNTFNRRARLYTWNPAVSGGAPVGQGAAFDVPSGIRSRVTICTHSGEIWGVFDDGLNVGAVELAKLNPSTQAITDRSGNIQIHESDTGNGIASDGTNLWIMGRDPGTSPDNLQWKYRTTGGSAVSGVGDRTSSPTGLDGGRTQALEYLADGSLVAYITSGDNAGRLYTASKTADTLTPRGNTSNPTLDQAITGDLARQPGVSGQGVQLGNRVFVGTSSTNRLVIAPITGGYLHSVYGVEL